MTAQVIQLWGGPWEKHIRIPGPMLAQDAKVIVLPVVRIERPAPKRRNNSKMSRK